MDFQMEIPRQCKKVLDIFEKNHYEAFLVGGCVRDTLLGKVPGDWDICTEALPEDILRIFSNYRVILTGLKHGTVTVLVDKMPIEITTYRIDGEYLDNRHPKEVIFTKKLKEDLSRRDFTVNALAYNPAVGLVDYFDGLSDLKKGIIKAVGVASERFLEDGLRLMRAIRFATVLDFAYDEETKMAISQYNYLLKNIATERIQVELNKILLSDHASRGLKDLYHFGCYSYILPEMCHLYGFEQNNPYHKDDVFAHTLESVDKIEKNLTLRLTMLLHDIGKPFVWQSCYESNDCFPAHEVSSAKIAKGFLRFLHYDNKTSNEVIKLIQHHNDHLLPEEENIRVNLRILGPESTRNLIKVKMADLKSQNETMTKIAGIFLEIEEKLNMILERGDCYSLKQLAINGGDLLAKGYQGKEIGFLLDQALEYVIKEPDKNTKEDLLNYVLHDNLAKNNR